MAARDVPIYGERDEGFFLLHFMPGTAVGDPTVWIERAQKLGAAATANLADVSWDVRYGPGPLQTLDVFRATGARPPLHLYFHGGYWRAYDKANYRYIPGMLVPRGATTVLANYDLCPSVTLDELVAEAIAAVAWVYHHGRELGGDPERLSISGSSAGGPLVAMMLAHDYTRNGLPADIVKGALSITGVHRLEPVLYIPPNDDIRLDAASAARNTTLDKAPVIRCPTIVAVGGDEPDEWIRMSVDYDTMIREHGQPGELMILAGTHHYSVTQTLSDPESRMSGALLEMIGLG